ncbi:MAG: sulfatase-like hydrolase/transferase [Chloroflexota bacterium]
MSERPNILFIIADDHRHDAVGAFGDPVVQTPALDSLARQGTAFRHTYIMGGLSGAVCVPTRAAVHTGASVFRATPGAMVEGGSHLTIDPSFTLLPETFRSNGYSTFGTGKWHNDRASFNRCFADGGNIFFGGMCDQDRVPVHQYDPSGAYPAENRTRATGFSTELFCDTAIDFLASHAAEGLGDDEPFFLYVSLTSPHDPRMAPAPYSHMYLPDEMPIPPNFATEHPFDNGDMVLRDETLTAFPRTHQAIQRHMADYYAMITHQDNQIQRLLDSLATCGFDENTIVVYTSDHGLSVGQHGLMGKQNMYDHSVRIPLIISGPSIPVGQEVHGLAYQMDIFPTLCGLAQVPTPSTVEGETLVPQMRGQETKGRESVLSVYRDVQRMVTDGEWKYIQYTPSPITRKGSDRIQLFHIKDDPWELKDLSGERAYQAEVARLSAILSDWQIQSGDFLQ